MASLFKQSIVLSLARVLALVVQFLNPVFLVRILSPVEYGRYQEFIVYSMLAASFIEFSINSNLTYFVSKDPGRARQYISNTTFLNLLFCGVGIAVIYLTRGQIRSLVTFDFVKLMVLYIATYVNFNYLEFYWIARRKTTNVLFYSFSLAIARTLVVVLVAFFTKNLVHVIYAVILLQAAKCTFVLCYLWSRDLMPGRVDVGLLKSQLKFAMPLGVAAVILYFNNDISKVIISSQLGAVALAMYAVGSKQVPMAGIIRASVADVVFPEVVRSGGEDPLVGLHLWKRANVGYTFVMLPVFVTLFYYAGVIITTLFTNEYARAVPIFRIYLLLMLLRDFVEMGTPLRALNQNKYFVYGNVLSLAVNIIVLYVLYQLYGFYGPAMALVVTTLALQVFLGNRITKTYKISMRNLFMWKKHFVILGTGAVCVPLLVVGSVLPLNPLAAAATFGLVYLAAYVFALKRLGIEEVDAITSRVWAYRLKLR